MILLLGVLCSETLVLISQGIKIISERQMTPLERYFVRHRPPLIFPVVSAAGKNDRYWDHQQLNADNDS